ncbi:MULTISPECIES: hypothetical protein [unclassified Corynebacterium]|uniref:hypothetical protein n=1 Tax=unclassified Corynebacterium TaxID=2624378 RepID=UPI001EF3DC96|nr:MULTISPECIES: hypothetical protein [unclassified Corynebacterium]MCG7290296.1 hypothetical protein [Corynebacterium sp. ACRPZ]MCG7294372.1 hypothetical protein [Corynebacterium sp. ACRPY]
MKRISTAAVAAATALSLATVPAIAQEDTAATTTGTTTEPTTPATEPSEPATEPTTPATETTAPATETTAPATETTQPAPTTKPQQPKPQQPKPQQPKPQTSGSSQGTIVGIFSGTLGAVLTTSLIVFSDPRGANKIIDMVNAQFGLGLPHLYTPKFELPNFQLPNFQLPNLPF